MIIKNFKKIVLPNLASDGEPTEVDMVSDLMKTFGLNTDDTDDDTDDTDDGGADGDDNDPPEEPDNNDASDDDDADDNNEPAEPPVKGKKKKPKTEEPLDIEGHFGKPKANEAFAAMRTQNKQYQNLVKGLSSLLGVKGDNPADIEAAVQNAITQAQAKQQGIPAEVLTRLRLLEEQNMQYSLAERHKQAAVGFENLKAKYSLDDTALSNFAQDLAKNGLNPFESQFDIEAEYVKRNYASIIKAAEERGAQAEAQRAARASSKGSNPGAGRGASAGKDGDAEIKTVSDLNTFLDAFKK